MNKEEYAIDEKTYENYDGLKIKIIFSILGRRYKKIGVNLRLMLEKETVKLEDSLTAMIRITKENEEIDRKMEIEKIKQQALMYTEETTEKEIIIGGVPIVIKFKIYQGDENITLGIKWLEQVKSHNLENKQLIINYENKRVIIKRTLAR